MLTLVLFDMYVVRLVIKSKHAKEMNSLQMNMHYIQYANLVIKFQFQCNERNNEIPRNNTLNALFYNEIASFVFLR